MLSVVVTFNYKTMCVEVVSSSYIFYGIYEIGKCIMLIWCVLWNALPNSENTANCTSASCCGSN
jgi:hypothetical protein